jgi:dolichol-phosphate mannosyltransferase
MRGKPRTPNLAVVVPFFNEADAAEGVVDELGAKLDCLGLEWEAILVDDGSRDGTAVRLERAQSRWPNCQILRFAENRGQGMALYDGICASRAPIVGTMDGDGQNVPSDFARLIPLLDRSDMVVGIRQTRRDSMVRRLISRASKPVRRLVLNDGAIDAGCGLKVFRREVITCLRPFPMLNTFMPALAKAAGFRVAELRVAHRPRITGRSKYGLRTVLWRSMADLAKVWWTLRLRERARRR